MSRATPRAFTFLVQYPLASSGNTVQSGERLLSLISQVLRAEPATAEGVMVGQIEARLPVHLNRARHFIDLVGFLAPIEETVIWDVDATLSTITEEELPTALEPLDDPVLKRLLAPRLDVPFIQEVRLVDGQKVKTLQDGAGRWEIQVLFAEDGEIRPVGIERLKPFRPPYPQPISRNLAPEELQNRLQKAILQP